MRCLITNRKTLKRLSTRLGRPVVRAMTRGGTDHRVDLLDAAGLGWSLFRDGVAERNPNLDKVPDVPDPH